MLDLPDIDHYFPGLVDFHKKPFIVNLKRTQSELVRKIRHRTHEAHWEQYFSFVKNVTLVSG